MPFLGVLKLVQIPLSDLRLVLDMQLLFQSFITPLFAFALPLTVAFLQQLELTDFYIRCPINLFSVKHDRFTYLQNLANIDES